MTSSAAATRDFELGFVVNTVAPYFDAAYYAAEYPDVRFEREQLVLHFCAFGWQEGRNANPYFDTVSYLQANRDVQRARMNPLLHYIVQGQLERREVVPSISPSVRSALLFGHAVPDWMEALRPEVDLPYYRSQLPGDLSDEIDLVAHFAFFGWREGLSPSPSHSMLALLRAYPDAVNAQVNPLLAHLEAVAGRYSVPSPLPEPSVLEEETPADSFAEEVVPDPRAQQLETVRAEFDAQYYLAAEQDVAAAGIDPLDHYFYTGWREERNPNRDFDTAYYLATNPDVAEAEVNPFWHYIAIGRAAGRLPRPPEAEAALPAAGGEDAEQIELMRTAFSETYYLFENADVAKAGIDPLLHYARTGWREGRNPNKEFGTKYYLEANEDVRNAGIHPFWHYLAAGQAEGRAPRRPGGFRRQIIEAAKCPEERARGWQEAKGKRVGRKALEASLRAVMAGRSGACVALSHDCYIRVIGGTQIFVADEQRAFEQRDHAYIHLSPRKPRLDLAPPDPEAEVQIVADGEFIGITPMRNLIAVLRRIREALTMPVHLIVHSVLGLNEVDIAELRDALAPENAFFWLHDYTSLCEGFNLLRNDLAYCHAPAATSQVCRVCVYGKTRARHQDRMRWLFERCRFHVLSPSIFSLELWKGKAALPALSAEVHEHWQLKPGPRPHKRRDATSGGPVRIAFIGFPSAAKGWHVFSGLVDRFDSDERYQFVHFGARGVATLPGCEFVVTEVTPANREAATRLLREHEIDFLAMLATWPETFSFVAHEGVAAGCQLLCFEDSGNVAALARRSGAGQVFQDLAELEGFLESPRAMKAAQRARLERRTSTIVNCGTTATATRFFKGVTPG